MKLEKDYSFIKGVCHGFYGGDEEGFRREIGFAKSIGVNSFRSWFSPYDWEKDRDAFLERVHRAVSIAWEYGISTMPILFNGNGLDPAMLDEEFMMETGDAYVKDMVGLLKNEPGFLMYDVMNEPTCNPYIMTAEGEEKKEHLDKMNRFLKHYCDLIKELDAENPITIGHTYPGDLEPSSEWVDVISFHDYLESTVRIDASYALAKSVAEKYGKPLINSELACIARANPYDLSIKKAYDNHVGFYAFELMIHGHWGGIHGFFYPDGTVRDPSTVAAFMGFFRKRTPDRIRFRPNQEGKAEQAIERLRKILKEPDDVFEKRPNHSEAVLEAAEWIINLLEGAELVPMVDPPSVKLNEYRMIPEAERPCDEIDCFAWEMAEKLRIAAKVL